jgi:serine/threonine protein phosphatase PrpC
LQAMPSNMVGGEGMELTFGAYSHPGKVRKINEDYFFIPTGKTTIKNLVIVADGMGGHNAGDIASRMVVEDIFQYYGQNMHQIVSPEDAKDSVIKSMQAANTKVYRQSKTHVRYEGMGTTLTLAYFYDNKACIGHVGDSRAYLIRDRTMTKITRDHSLVQELLENGSISQEEVDTHPQKNIITRALGAERHVEIDYYELLLKDKDIILLCTDGLTQHVDLNENIELFYSYDSLYKLTTVLGEKALENGGTDNITIVMAKCSCMAEKR